MANGAGLPEKRVLTQELIEQIDERIDSPRTRAEAIWHELRVRGYDFTDWDIVCFSVEALGLISERYPYLREEAKRLNRLVYSAHYLYPENYNVRVAGEPPPGRAYASGESQKNSTGANEESGSVSRDDTIRQSAVHLSDHSS